MTETSPDSASAPPPLSACRLCGCPELTGFLSLGRMPLANALLAPAHLAQPEALYPLDVVLCPRCTLVQITETVAPEELFRDYPYFSSVSETMVRHAEALVKHLKGLRPLDGHSLVVEVGSNDGYLLRSYHAGGIPVLGIEPAANIAREARARGIQTVCDFFDRGLAERLRRAGCQADLLHAHNVLAHVPDVNGFVDGLRSLLKADGLAVIEVPYVKDLIDRCEFDTIYHEHLCYFSMTALHHLFRLHRLVIQDVERLPIHGGSLRLFVTVQDGPRAWGRPRSRVEELLAEEAAWGAGRLEVYEAFARRVRGVRERLRQLLTGLRRQGKRLAAYGAAAKGSVLLNYVGIGPDLLDFVVDRSPHKQGRYIPGVRVPIYPPPHLLDAMPDYVLVLVWNILDEVVRQQEGYRRRGGRFIVPIPEATIV